MGGGLPAPPAAPSPEPASVGVKPPGRSLCGFGRSFCVPALTLPEGPLVTLTSPATVTDELPRSKTPANRSWLFELAATSPPLPVPLTTSPPRPLASVSEPWMSIELSVSAARKAWPPCPPSFVLLTESPPSPPVADTDPATPIEPPSADDHTSFPRQQKNENENENENEEVCGEYR